MSQVDTCHSFSCPVDSSRRLLQYRKQGPPVQIGVVSFGVNWRTTGKPNAAAFISSFLDWISARGSVCSRSTNITSQFGNESRGVGINDTDNTNNQTSNEEIEDVGRMFDSSKTVLVITTNETWTRIPHLCVRIVARWALRWRDAKIKILPNW